MIDIIGFQNLPRELLQIEVFFVGRVVGTDHTESPVLGLLHHELLRDGLQRVDQETGSSLPFTRSRGDCRRSGCS